jgi:hypothetical protein
VVLVAARLRLLGLWLRRSAGAGRRGAALGRLAEPVVTRLYGEQSVGPTFTTSLSWAFQ